MKKIHYWTIAWAFALMGLLSGCEKSDPAAFSAEPAILFEYGNTHNRTANIRSIDYSFLVNPDDFTILKIPVVINGFPVDYDRPFEVEVLDDELTTATPDQYELLESVIHAGNMVDTLYVRLLKSEELENTVARIHLSVRENEHFKLGIAEKRLFRISWSNQAIMPTWGVYFRTFFSAVGSTQAYRIFVQITGLTNFLVADFRAVGQQPGAEVLGTRFGDYIKQWNLDHPDDILRHDDGASAGQPIVPVYYTRSLYD